MAMTDSIGALSSWPDHGEQLRLRLVGGLGGIARASRSAASPSTRPWICANRSSGWKSSACMTICPPLVSKSGQTGSQTSLKTRLSCHDEIELSSTEIGEIGHAQDQDQGDLERRAWRRWSGSCPHLARVHAIAGDPPLRRRAAGFKGLARVIVGQQLSVASAAAIWERLEATRSAIHPRVVPLARPAERIAAAGLSGVKIATLRGRWRTRSTRGTLDLDALTHAPEDVIHAELTALKGIGPWTADIYILFCLARADAWSPGDLALQYAVKDALGARCAPRPR